MFYREKLKGIRKIKKITQTELGVALGKSQEIVGYWEQGRRKPCDSDIRMMATYLNIPVQEISDLSEFKKNKHTGDIDLLDLKLTELDNLLDEYGEKTF